MERHEIESKLRGTGMDNEDTRHQVISVFPTLSAVVEYKSFKAVAYLTSFMEDAKLIYGYNPGTEVFVDEIHRHPEVEKLVKKDMPFLFRTKPAEYNFENKLITKCSFPHLKIFSGPLRTEYDFQNRLRRYRVKNTGEDDVAYISETGHFAPPLINFNYNPATTLEENMKEFKQEQFKINPENMFLTCTKFQRWVFEKATVTRPDRKIHYEQLLRTPKEKRYDLSFLNTYMYPDEDSDDVILNVNNYFEMELYRNENLQGLIGLSKELYFDLFPKLMENLHKDSVWIKDHVQLRRRMDKFGVPFHLIGLIAANTKIPHIREICLYYMIADAIAKILSFAIFDKYLDVTFEVTTGA